MKNRNTPLKKGGIFLTILFVVAVLNACSSPTKRINVAINSHTDNIIVANIISKKDTGIYSYDEKKFYLKFPAPVGVKFIMMEQGDGALFAVTEEHGIYIYSDFKEPPLHIPVAKDALVDKKILSIAYQNKQGIRTLFVSYDYRGGAGITVCTITEKWDSFNCKTFTTENSELKSNYVRQITADSRGNVWFRYPPNLEKGVSRINNAGKWDHFDKNNSNIGESGVYAIRAEPKGSGVTGGDTVWFVTDAGLSALKYIGADKEEFKLYGEKQSVGSKLTTAFGIQGWFSDAITEITDMAIIKGAVLISSKTAIFKFDGRNIDRIIPIKLGGIDDVIVRSIATSGEIIYVLKAPFPNGNNTYSGMNAYNTRTKKWYELNMWLVAKASPNSVLFLPYKEKLDLVIFNYIYDDSKFALFNHDTCELKPITVQFVKTAPVKVEPVKVDPVKDEKLEKEAEK